MEKEKIIEIVNNVQNKSNKDLIEARDVLLMEHQKTKNIILDLTRHLDSIEYSYDIINNEIKKRILQWK